MDIKGKKFVAIQRNVLGVSILFGNFYDFLEKPDFCKRNLIMGVHNQR